MTKQLSRPTLSLLGCLPLLIANVSACADECTSAIPLVGTGSAAIMASGNSCNGGTTLPFLANGAIATNGTGVDVYHVTSRNVPFLTLQPQAGVDLALLVCPSQCSTYATCFVADNGGAGAIETLTVPSAQYLVSDYFVMVAGLDTASPGCGDYQLIISGYIDD